MTGEPHPHTLADPSAAHSTVVLGELADLLARYRRLEQQTGMHERDTSERLYHLDQLLETLRRYIVAGKPARALLIAIAAQAVQWAATLERADR